MVVNHTKSSPAKDSVVTEILDANLPNRHEIPIHSPAKCRTEAPDWYGSRQQIPEDKIPFSDEFSGYSPRFIISSEHAERVLRSDAHPQDIRQVSRESLQSFLPLEFDKEGYPLTPLGRTGVRGLGELYYYGASFTADTLIRRWNPSDGHWEMLAILRDDCHQRAIIGGFHDKGETVVETACREVKEEVQLEIDPSRLRIIYQGPVDDRRTTDNAWIETTLFDYIVSYEESLKLNPIAGDDAESVDWVPMTEEYMSQMYASHGLFARMVLVASNS